MPVQIISSNISSNAVALERPTSTHTSSVVRSAGFSPQAKAAPTELQVDSSSQISSSFQALSNTTTKINQVAVTVRHADSTMEKVGRAVGKMKGTLEGIIKNYPPFPPGSEQRVKALKGFAALRREIEEMTFPPDSSLLPKLLSDPAKSPGTFSVTLDSKGTTVQLDRQQVDPGPSGLNIPLLPVMPPEDSGDEPIHEAISALGVAGKTVSDRRSSLSENFSKQALPAVVASVASQTALIDSLQSTTLLSEQSALSKSRDIIGAFSSTPAGMSVSGDTFLKRIT